MNVPEEALRYAGCPSDRRITVGDCNDAGTCGCSLGLEPQLVSHVIDYYLFHAVEKAKSNDRP